MMSWILKRNDTGKSLALHGQYDWSDEYEWTPIAQSEPVYTITGSQIIQQGTKKAGRPISLDGANTRISRADIETLQKWASVASLTMTLTDPKGNDYKVVFSRPFITDIDGKIFKKSDQQESDRLRCNINFISV